MPSIRRLKQPPLIPCRRGPTARLHWTRCVARPKPSSGKFRDFEFLLPPSAESRFLAASTILIFFFDAAQRGAAAIFIYDK